MSANVRKSKVLKIASEADLCHVPCFKEDLVRRLRAEMPGDEQLEEIRVLFRPSQIEPG